MTEYRLQLVADIVARMTIDLPDERPFLVSNGPDSYLCGACGNGLLIKVEIALPQNVAIICGKCRARMILAVATE